MVLLSTNEPGSLIWGGRTLERPKSQILIYDWLSIRIFAGLRSLCIRLAEWMNLIAHKRLYIITIMCCSLILVPWFTDIMIFLASASTKSMTINRELNLWLSDMLIWDLLLSVSDVFLLSAFKTFWFSINSDEWTSHFYKMFPCSQIWIFGIIMSWSFVVNTLFFISDSYIKIYISLKTSFPWNGLKRDSYINLIAQILPVWRCLALTTCPKEPFPMISSS